MKGQELTETTNRQVLTAVDVRKQVNLIQEVMENVMKDGEHYGIVPGTQKKTLFKSGAEKLAMTFRLSAEYEELPGSLENDQFICYKINCKLTHIPTGQIIGNGRGTCNSKEKKYLTRSVYEDKANDEEKTIGKKAKRGNCNVFIVPQSPWDVQNTIYKMACKRALVAAILNATAASDIFTQDIEDLPEGTVIDEAVVANGKPKVDMPQAKQEPKKEPAKTTKQEAQEIAQEIMPEETDITNVAMALKAKVNTTIPAVYGIFQESSTRQVNTKNGPSDITSYNITQEGDADIDIVIQKWGSAHEDLQMGQPVTFFEVKVTEYRNNKQYLAQEIQ